MHEKISYHKAADQFLKSFYEQNGEKSIFFSYHFMSRLAKEGKQVARSVDLKDMDHQNAIVAVWFRYAGQTEVVAEVQSPDYFLLNKYFEEVNYPLMDRGIVMDTVATLTEGKYAETKLQKVASDAIYSQFSFPGLAENIILLKEETTRLSGHDEPEIFFLKFYHQLFIKTRYYTDYALNNYSNGKERNFQLLEKRIAKLSESDKGDGKSATDSPLSNKETEDLFKLGFRNYNHLISVADSKASLLIHVNSIIISVMLAFLLGKLNKSMILLWPTVLLLSISMITIFVSVLASRPQKSFFAEDHHSKNFQWFFFGSFDLIDSNFRHATWDTYYDQLTSLFSSPKETVYMEMYKESFNVRKVLAKKFNYLSIAYWIFLGGLLLSIIAFVVAIQTQTSVK